MIAWFNKFSENYFHLVVDKLIIGDYDKEKIGTGSGTATGTGTGTGLDNKEGMNRRSINENG